MSPFQCTGENGVVDADGYIRTPLGGIDCPTRDLLYTTVRRFPMSFCTMLAARSWWTSFADDQGPFDETLWQGSDARFLFQVALRRTKVVGVDRPLTTVRLNPGSLTADRSTQLRYNGRVYLRNLIDLLSAADRWPYVGTMLRNYWSEALAAGLDRYDPVAVSLRQELNATVVRLAALGTSLNVSAKPLHAVIGHHCQLRADIRELFASQAISGTLTQPIASRRLGESDRRLWISPSYPAEFADTNQAALAMFSRWDRIRMNVARSTIATAFTQSNN